MHGQRETGKIQRNGYHHGNCGPSLTGKTSSLSLIFTHWTHHNVKNRWVRSSLNTGNAVRLLLVNRRQYLWSHTSAISSALMRRGRSAREAYHQHQWEYSVPLVYSKTFTPELSYRLSKSYKRKIGISRAFRKYNYCTILNVWERNRTWSALVQCSTKTRAARRIPNAHSTCNWLYVDSVRIVWFFCRIYVCWILDWSTLVFEMRNNCFFSECSVDSMYSLVSYSDNSKSYATYRGFWTLSITMLWF